MRVCCLTITFQFSRLHSDASWPETCKASLGYRVGSAVRRRRAVEVGRMRGEGGRRNTAEREGARWRKCSGDGQIRREDRDGEEEILKVEKESSGGRMDNSAGE